MVLPYSNLQLKHQNPMAEKPLILPVHLVCNTSDELLFGNIKENSKRPRWLKSSPAHDGVAVICGSGPSLADHLDDIKKWQSSGATIYSMNGSTSYLAINGIFPDYQVIIDAREETAQLVGPARHHLFASQVHPACFKQCPDAQVWHLQIENIEDYFPEEYEEHVQIGGAAAVGNTTACLAYAMGYRTVHIYGLDSSHREGNGHAFHQKMNDGDPTAWVTFCGKEYLCSLTMKLQAEKFQETARDLQQLGMKMYVYGDGLLPAMFNTPKEILSEQEKYERMWAIKGYRTYSPGEDSVKTFEHLVLPPGTVLDIGCGTGRAGIKLKALGFDVTLMDFTENSRDYEAMVMPFIQHDMTKPFPMSVDHGFCADVMEHIPTGDVPQVLKNIRDAVRTCFFQISTQPDHFGAVINQDLHLTVQPGSWWSNQVESAGFHVVYIEETDECVKLFLN